jgi:hypothetical protein
MVRGEGGMWWYMKVRRGKRMMVRGRGVVGIKERMENT